MNGGVIRGRPGPRRGCSATYGWNWLLLLLL
jgi:hypothetical protein